MVKLMAVLRSLFFVFICLYAIKAMPLALMLSSEGRRGEVMVPVGRVQEAASVTWIAILWILFEVAVGWLHVWAAGKLRQRAAAKAAAAPPPASRGV
jgi:hypothetical protein